MDIFLVSQCSIFVFFDFDFFHVVLNNSKKNVSLIYTKQFLS